MDILFTLILIPLFAWAGYSLAKRKNRNATMWAVLCGLFGIIPLIVILALGPATEDPFANSLPGNDNKDV